MSEENPKDVAKASLCQELKNANKHLSPAEIAKEIIEVMGKDAIALQGQLVFQITGV